MSVVGYRVRNHPQQVARRGALSAVDDRATSPDFFATLDVIYGFTLDVAASAHNAKCERYFTVAQDGLRQSWAGEMVWCNPPYSSIAPWVAKSWREYESARGIVMLLPANRTEQKWWQLLVEPRRDQPGSPLRVKFLPGRLRFIHPESIAIGPNERPPFGCCLLIWGYDMTAELVALGRCPTCREPRWRVARCTCTHLVMVHDLNKRGTRTACSHLGCGCKAFEEAP